MTRSTVSEWALPWGKDDAETLPEVNALTVAWSLEEPERIGEAARIDGPCVLGRRDAGGGDSGHDVLGFFRERPTGRSGGKPLSSARISRQQLELATMPNGGVRVVNVGKCPLLVNGQRVTEAVVEAGDTLSLQNSAVLLVVRRGAMQPLASYPARLAFAFGDVDPHGMIGESPTVWALRDALAFAAGSPHHVLLHGPSGAGKELAARTIHHLSTRSEGSFVARNAATLPEGLVDAELFGNLKNYPNPGMPERRGLVGEADGGTLFLDEVGELPVSLQAHLLRVLDRGGEYQRLGDARPARSDFRLIAATNRSPQELKHDLLARFASRIAIPSLETRREDIPLLVRSLLERARASTPALGRFFGTEGARLDPTLIELLLRHDYSHELRELDRLLWVAASSSRGKYIAATPELLSELGKVEAAPAEPSLSEPGRAEIEQALAAASGSVTRAARALGLKNRFALYRLMKRHGLGNVEHPGES